MTSTLPSRNAEAVSVLPPQHLLKGKTCFLPLSAVRLVPRTYLYLIIVQLYLLSRAIHDQLYTSFRSEPPSGYEPGPCLAHDILLCI